MCGDVPGTVHTHRQAVGLAWDRFARLYVPIMDHIQLLAVKLHAVKGRGGELVSGQCASAGGEICVCGDYGAGRPFWRVCDVLVPPYRQQTDNMCSGNIILILYML